jgi:hypothetical protein
MTQERKTSSPFGRGLSTPSGQRLSATYTKAMCGENKRIILGNGADSTADGTRGPLERFFRTRSTQGESRSALGVDLEHSGSTQGVLPE